jgi:acyl-CoA dehydrogenase
MFTYTILNVALGVFVGIVALGFLTYHRASAWIWGLVALCGALAIYGAQGPTVITLLIGALAAGLLIFGAIKPIRRAVLSGPIFSLYKKILPQMSDTEREALEAGTVWWDGDLFTGKPNWNKMLAIQKATLTAEEKAFIDGPLDQLCNMVDEWKATHEDFDLPADVWQFIKDKGFLGMIIPKQYGGLEFSPFAQSEIVTRLSTRGATAAVSVMVPNSLGPGELLMHYGTEAQKNHYLPRLAKGLEVPCFGLTSPDAGSDAGSIPDMGVVCKGMWQGKEVLGMKLTFEKRYITLAPVATLIGLAFKLYDPDKLLGNDSDLGITLALIPRETPGLNVGRRHFPLNAVFMNGPLSGKEMFVPLDYIIGGAAMAGKGWRMLMDCLSVGRAISLPGNAMGMAAVATRMTGAYARIRTQFKTPIGKFEGVEEAMARIGGYCYLMDATRQFTMAALNAGEAPSVISAINKYHMTERGRIAMNDAMDVHGGKGICMGPNNYLARGYQSIPVMITVEGANILTRSMIIFGQGAIRCHPYVLKEMVAARENSLKDFDVAFWSHISFTLSNTARALWLGITGGKGVRTYGSPETHRHFQQMTRFSSAFGLLADISMFVIGGSLKRKEKLSARLGDVLSLLYMSSAALKRYHDDGCPKEDLPYLTWSIHDCFFKIQVAMDGIIQNFPNRSIAWLLRRLVFPKGITLKAPTDRMGHEVAKGMMEPGAARDRLTAMCHVSRSEHDAFGRVELAFEATVAAEPLEAKIRDAIKAGKVESGRVPVDTWANALKAGAITDLEHAQLVRAAKLKRAVVDVDDFEFDFGMVAKSKVEALNVDTHALAKQAVA